MNSNSPPEQLATAAAGESTSPFRDLLDTSLTIKQNSPAPPSRPSSVLPSILASLTSSQEGNTKAQSPDRIAESFSGPVIDIPSQSPTPHSDTCPSTPVCGVPPFSPESERSSCGSTSATAPQQFCLRWNNYQSNLTSVFDQLLQNESFVDVTLACDGRSIKAHKMILSACSPYFEMLLSTTPCTHPIVILRDVNWFDLKSIVDFMYKGEINVSQEQIGPILRIAEMLKVRGLADVSNIGSSVSTAHFSPRHGSSADKELYTAKSAVESPKRHQKITSPSTKRPQSQYQDSDNVKSEHDQDISTHGEPEKKARLDRSDWDIGSGAGLMTESSNLELRLSPLPHQHFLGRNVRKRRWPSADAIFNPPESPLSSLIAAERAEQERERERTRERVREASLFTPPIPATSGSSSTVAGLNSCMSTAGLESSAHMEIPSPSPTPTPNLLPPSRTPSGILTPSPHLQMSHHHQQQQLSHQQHPSGFQSHRSSPASSVTSTHPSSVLSRPLTPSPASVGLSAASSRLEGGPMTGDSHRYPMGPAQAAAMAAAAAQMDLGAGTTMVMRPHSSSGSSLGPGQQGPGHHSSSLVDDLEIKPGIAEMIREEERVLKPVWLYGIQLWGCAKNTEIEKIQRYQNKILRCIVQAPWYIRNSDLHRDLKITTVKEEVSLNAHKHQVRLHQHTNNEIPALLHTSELTRRLQRFKPHDLMNRFNQTIQP